MASFNFVYPLRSPSGELVKEIECVCRVSPFGLRDVFVLDQDDKEVDPPASLHPSIEIFVDNECREQLAEARREARYEAAAYDRELARALRRAS